MNITARRSNRLSGKLDPNVKQLKLSFELNIRRLNLQKAEDDTDFFIVWVRGEKKIDTKVRQAQQGQVKFSEKFMMTTKLEYDKEKEVFISKPVSTLTNSLTQCALVFSSSHNGRQE